MRSQHTATKSSPRSMQLEKAHVQHQRRNTAKKLIIFLKTPHLLKKKESPVQLLQ